MPAWRLDEADRQVTQFDVGAIDGDKEHFVRHVLLCDTEKSISISAESSIVPAIHMGPPLVRSQEQIDVLGKAGLDNDKLDSGERRQIKNFVDERHLELKAQQKMSQYIIHPAAKEPDKSCTHWRFNCAGFVLRAYLEAGIELIDQKDVPEVSLDILQEAFPRAKKHLNKSSFREQMGIGEGDQWPVLLAGYIVNSLNRPAEEIRESSFRPRSGDEFFPNTAKHLAVGQPANPSN